MVSHGRASPLPAKAKVAFELAFLLLSIMQVMVRSFFTLIHKHYCLSNSNLVKCSDLVFTYYVLVVMLLSLSFVMIYVYFSYICKDSYLSCLFGFASQWSSKIS